MSSEALQLYVAYGQRRGNDALHWIILAVPENSDRCTYYHVTGGPTQGTNYVLQIEANKRVNSNGIASSEHVGAIKKSDVNKLKASAQKVAPQFCQSWAVEVLGDLERKGLVVQGTKETWQAKMERDPYAQNQATAAEETNNDVWDEVQQRWRRWNGAQWVWL